MPCIAGLVPNADPVHKVSVIPRGRALGMTMQLPLERSPHLFNEVYLQVDARGDDGWPRRRGDRGSSHLTTGAGDDIEKGDRRSLARWSVSWGMSEKPSDRSPSASSEETDLPRP